jgi:hypothetical protein
MTEPNEPKKETTRIPVAPEVAEKPPEPNAKSRDTVRIQLPLREPPVHIFAEPQPAVREGGSPQFFQPPQPPPVPLNAAVMPAPDLPSSGLIKETVRIPLPTVQTKKTQPLVAIPEVEPHQSALIAVAAEEKNPTPLLWLLLGVSALILIIQIWTYLS